LASWFDQAFSDKDGVANYFRQMSGSRRFVEWQSFGPIELMTLAQKLAFDAQGGASTIAGFRQAAIAKGIPVNSFDRFMWVIDDNGASTRGVTISDTLAGAIDFEPQLATHEMTHDFGVCSHADRVTLDDYSDPFCIMGMGPVARSFQNPHLATPAERFTHATTGPVTSAAYLFVTGWLDYRTNVVEIAPNDLPQPPTGPGIPIVISVVTTLDANQGAPPPGSANKIAITSGSVPRQTSDPAQIWIEYRHPSGLDRGVDRAVSAATPDMPPEGVVVLHSVQFDPIPVAGQRRRCNNSLHSFLTGFIPARPGSVSPSFLGHVVRVVSVDGSRRQVSLTIELQ
jgi:hypothetical protein